MKNKKHVIIVIVSVIAYIGMIATNALANILPINNVTTGQVSDMYPNLFAPAPITFAIWSVIYLMLFAHIIYRIRSIKYFNPAIDVIGDKIGIQFAVTSVINALWMVAWHYQIMWLALVLMIGLLVTLIRINTIVNQLVYNKKMFWVIKAPFEIYLGWISVATIANTTTLLVSIGWDGFGINEEIWLITVLVIGTIIGIYGIFNFKGYIYGLVFMWAYLGIFIKHYSITGFGKAYPVVLADVLAMILLLAIGELLYFFKSNHLMVIKRKK